MGEEGSHDYESGRFGEGERVSARDVDATADTTVVAARACALVIAVVVTSVARDVNAALGALVTVSSGACTVTTLVTRADTDGGRARECRGSNRRVACTLVMRRLFPSAFIWLKLLEYVLGLSVVIVQHDYRLGA